LNEFFCIILPESQAAQLPLHLSISIIFEASKSTTRHYRSHLVAYWVLDLFCKSEHSSSTRLHFVAVVAQLLALASLLVDRREFDPQARNIFQFPSNSL
jgi:hypothetical protein